MTGSRTVAIIFVMALVGAVAAAEIVVEARVIELPVGAIVAFPNSCPADGNWEEYHLARGRFLIGAGSIREMNREILPGDSDDTVTHNHAGRTEAGGSARGVDNDDDHSTSDHLHTHAIKTDSHLPPYVAVVFCQLK